MYPTPRTSGGSRPNGKGGKVLEEEVMIQEGLRERGKTLNQMYPTPTAADTRTDIRTKDQLSEKAKKGGCSNLREFVHQNQMYPTPISVEVGKGKMLETLETKDGQPAKLGERAYNPKTGKHVQMTLDRVMKMYPTPVSNDHDKEKIDVWKKRSEKKKEEGINLHFALRHAVQMYPTPRVSDTEGGIVKNVEMNNGSFSRKNKKGTRWGVKLKDAVNYLEENEMYPTPRSRDWKDTMNTIPPSVGKTRSHTLGTKVAEQRLMYGTPLEQDSRAALTDRGKNKMGEQVHQENNAKETGARLSPNFVEFLMGYPPNWTKLEPID